MKRHRAGTRTPRRPGHGTATGQPVSRFVAEVEPAAQPAVTAAFDIADAEALLVRAFEQIGTDTPTAGTVKNKMLVLDPSFDQANYGCRTFRDFLNRLSHRVAPAGRSGNDITIRLIHTAA